MKSYNFRILMAYVNYTVSSIMGSKVRVIPIHLMLVGCVR